MNNVVKWGVLGPGFIAHRFADSFPKNATMKLQAVGAVAQQMASDYAAKYNVPSAYGSYEELLADKEVDIIYIATPTSVHHTWIMNSLNAGKHVLCEKTITMNATQLKECMDLAHAKGLILAEGLTSIYEPVMKTIKDMIVANRFGKLHFVTVTCGSLKEYSPNNRYFSPSLGGGALFDIGCYAIGFANYFLSSYPTVVKSEGMLAGTGVDLKSAYVLRNKEDELATVLISLRSKTEKIGIIACEDAFIRIEGFIRASKATVTYTDGRSEVYEFPNFGLDKEVEILSQDILANRKDCSICPSEFSHSILAVMDEARAQWGYQFDFEKGNQ